MDATVYKQEGGKARKTGRRANKTKNGISTFIIRANAPAMDTQQQVLRGEGGQPTASGHSANV